MTQFSVGLLDSIFGEKLTIELPRPDGTTIKRTVTKKWHEQMEREQKIRRVVRAHVLSPFGYSVQQWAVGEDVDREQWEHFRDPVTDDLYVLTCFEEGDEKRTVMLKHVWEQARTLMADGGIPGA